MKDQPIISSVPPNSPLPSDQPDPMQKSLADDLYKSVVLQDLNERVFDKQQIQRISLRQKIIFMVYCLCLFIAFLIANFDPEYRNKIIYYIQQLNQKEPMTTLLTGLVQMVCIWMGLPVSVLELLLGALLEDTLFALCFSLFFKITAILCVVLLVRYLLREITEDIFRNNRLYRIISYSLHQNPFKVILILRFIWIPLQIKNIFTGLLTVPFSKILVPVVLVEVFYSLLNINTGKMFKDILFMVNQKQEHAELHRKKFWLQMGVGAIFIVAFIWIVTWIKKEYYHIQQQMDINDLLNEHEQDALLVTQDVYSAPKEEKENIKK